jgi:hypothetical protein
MSDAVSEADYASRFLGLTRLALEAPDVPTAVAPILESLVSSTAAVGAAYFQLKDLAFFARAAHGVMPEGQAMAAILQHGLPADAPLLVALTSTRHACFFDDTSAAPEAAGFAGLGVASLAAAPVFDSWGRLQGAFLMHSFLPHVWGRSEIMFLTGIADVLAHLASRLVAEEQATEAREGALRALGLALELRDGETKGHTDRVTGMAIELAKAAGLNGHELVSVRWGAYLHDIGKIGIPDDILRKPGPLTDDEWKVMRRHPLLGHEFGQRLGFLGHNTLAVILHHHERWDGRGYPRGLAAQAIPLEARIFSLCDVFDALRSDRPYKTAWDLDRTLDHLSQQAGSQFDPELTRLFVERVGPSA